MANPFPNTVGALAADRHRTWLFGALVALVLCGAWGAWLFTGELWVYVSTSEARLEVIDAVRPVEAAVEGKVIASHMELGARVTQGEPLLEVDASDHEFMLEEAEAQLGSYRADLHELTRILASEQAVVAGMAMVAAKVNEEAQARADHADAAADFAETKSRRLSGLGGNLPALELLDVETEARKQRVLAQVEHLDRDRLIAENELKRRDRLLKMDELRREIAGLEGDIREGEARCRRLQTDIARHTVRAPVAGRLGEITPTPAGSVVTVGQRVATVVPDGELELVASFPVQQGLGRIKPGQAARLRLAAFPWTQYGSLRATVRRVAGEPRDGAVRVEMQIEPGSSARVPVEHGLVGTVEIAVERVTPAILLLRAAGHLETTRDQSEAPAAGVPIAKRRVDSGEAAP